MHSRKVPAPESASEVMRNTLVEGAFRFRPLPATVVVPKPVAPGKTARFVTTGMAVGAIVAVAVGVAVGMGVAVGTGVGTGV